jgi:hypothetical protein
MMRGLPLTIAGMAGVAVLVGAAQQSDAASVVPAAASLVLAGLHPWLAGGLLLALGATASVFVWLRGRSHTA